jgi:hypothetical protein
MSLSNVKNLVRLGLLVATIVTVACASPTAPNTPVSVNKPASKDTVPDGQPEEGCRSGWTVMGGRWVCGTNEG